MSEILVIALIGAVLWLFIQIKAKGAQNLHVRRYTPTDESVTATPMRFFTPQEAPWEWLPPWTGPESSRPGVSMSDYSCTCEKWVKHHGRAPSLNIRRLCSCLRSEIMQQPEILTQLHPITQDLITKTLYPVDDISAIQVVHFKEARFILTYADNAEWVNIIGPHAARTRDNGIAEHGFGLEREAWARGSLPKYATEVRQAIKTWMRSLRQGYAAPEVYL